MPLTVEVVPGTEKGPVFYKIVHERDGRSWTATRRFSALDAMRHALWKKSLPPPDVDFPRKQAPLARLANKWQAPWAPATPAAMPADEMEERRSGLQAYLSSLSKMEGSWKSDIVTKVLCAETEEASTVGSPATEQQPEDVQDSPTSRSKAVSWVDDQTPTSALTAVATETSALSKHVPLVSPPPLPQTPAVSAEWAPSTAPPSRPANDTAKLSTISGDTALAAGMSSAAGAVESTVNDVVGGAVAGDYQKKVEDDQPETEQPPSTSAVVCSDDSSRGPAPIAANEVEAVDAIVDPAAAPLAAALPVVVSDASDKSSSGPPPVSTTDVPEVDVVVTPAAAPLAAALPVVDTDASDKSSSGPPPVSTTDVPEVDVVVTPAAAPLAAALPVDTDENGNVGSATNSTAAPFLSSPERETGAGAPATVVADATAFTPPSSSKNPLPQPSLSRRSRERERRRKSHETAEVAELIEGVPAAADALSISTTEKDATATPPASASGPTVILPPEDSAPAAAAVVAAASSSLRSTVDGVGETAAAAPAVSPEVVADASEEVAAGQNQIKQATATDVVPAGESVFPTVVRSATDQEAPAPAAPEPVVPNVVHPAADQPLVPARALPEREGNAVSDDSGNPVNGEKEEKEAEGQGAWVRGREGASAVSQLDLSSTTEDLSSAAEEGDKEDDGDRSKKGKGAEEEIESDGGLLEVADTQAKEEANDSPLPLLLSSARAAAAARAKAAAKAAEVAAAAATSVVPLTPAESDGDEGKEHAEAAAPAAPQTMILPVVDVKGPQDGTRDLVAPAAGPTRGQPAGELIGKEQQPAAAIATGPAPVPDITLASLAADAVASAVAVEEELGEDTDGRARGAASAVSALTLSSATEDAKELPTVVAPFAERAPQDSGVFVANTEAAAASAQPNDQGVGGDTTGLPTPTTAKPKRRSSLLGRAKKSFSSKMVGGDTKQKAVAAAAVAAATAAAAAAAGGTNPATEGSEKPSSAATIVAALPSLSPATNADDSASASASTPTPRSLSKLASFRNKAKGFTGRLSVGGGSRAGRDGDAGGPLSARLSGSGPVSSSRRSFGGPLSATGKGGGGFFSMTTRSPPGDVPPGSGDGGKGEPGASPQPPPLSPDGVVKSGSGAKPVEVAGDVFMAVGDRGGTADSSSAAAAATAATAPTAAAATAAAATAAPLTPRAE